MDYTTYHPWVSEFLRVAHLRRMLVLHGNVHDRVIDSQRGTETQTIEAIRTSLLDAGWKQVGVWTRGQGLQEMDRDLLNQPSPASNNEYDMEGLPDQRGRSQETDPQAMVELARSIWSQPETSPSALIVDWSDYVFGHATSYSDVERKWLTDLQHSMHAHIKDENSSQPGNLVILITPRLAALPISLYQNNPYTGTINIPHPTRKARQRWLEKNRHKFLLDSPLKSDDIHTLADASESLTLQDLVQISRLSHVHHKMHKTLLKSRQLMTLYMYSQHTSPWEELNWEKLAQLQQDLEQYVKGQPLAIQKVVRVIRRAYIGLSGLHHSNAKAMPKGTLFFVGPTGVGKTELAKAIARFLFGDEKACIRFDMSEYNHEHSDQKLIGAPPGYVGYENGGQLTNAVRARPFSVLLFDEIEKAHGRILDKFLQILEDGRLTDGKGETVSFSESIIIFTSNIGASQVDAEMDDQTLQKHFQNKVAEHFTHKLERPELLNRIGNGIVPFTLIRDRDIHVQIIRSKLVPLQQFLNEKYGIIELVWKDEARDLANLAKHAQIEAGGRGLLNQLQSIVLDPLAEFLFSSASFKEARGKRILAALPDNAEEAIFKIC